ncbi:MAG TPA: hypothetical protein VM050_01720 [Patescibacteria group bacterium]|nr:hypothetical protein [Patescibacteria group bacterium]
MYKVDNALFKRGFPLITIMMISLVTFSFIGLTAEPISLERGVEIMRMSGYEVDRDNSWENTAMELGEPDKVGFRSFKEACEKVNEETGQVTVHVDRRARVTFIYHPAVGNVVRYHSASSCE